MHPTSPIPDVVRDVSGERLAAAAGIGAGIPVLAFDVGGTDIKSALFDADGTAVGLAERLRGTHDTHHRTPPTTGRKDRLSGSAPSAGLRG